VAGLENISDGLFFCPLIMSFYIYFLYSFPDPLAPSHLRYFFSHFSYLHLLISTLVLLFPYVVLLFIVPVLGYSSSFVFTIITICSRRSLNAPRFCLSARSWSNF
jgi:hypothetical protein